MIKFEKVSRLADVDFALPVRKTVNSAGYDMVVAEDIVVPPYKKLWASNEFKAYDFLPKSLVELEALTKEKKIKPTLVSSGVKCALDPNSYLELNVRSSTPLKYWLLMANGVGR